MDLLELKKKALSGIKNAGDLEVLEELRRKYLGRKGELTKILRSLKDLPLTQRKKIGSAANAIKKELGELFDKKVQELSVISRKSLVRFDVTRPAKKVERGHLHPLTAIDEEIRRIFTSLNFSVVEGPELEIEYYNFDALNIPPQHPARDLWNTFWISQASNVKGQRLLLRTHTSPMQVRYMETHNPPFQIIVPGRVFRYEATDTSHEINFYQLEGLMVGENVSLANFKYVVEEFFKKFFGPKIQFRFRPTYFPFVEPGLEVDIRFKGKWLEMMGAGMVHRRVFDAAHYPPKIQGFAFGMGLDRLAMIKYKIPDIRLFYSGDLRFVRQF